MAVLKSMAGLVIFMSQGVRKEPPAMYYSYSLRRSIRKSYHDGRHVPRFSTGAGSYGVPRGLHALTPTRLRF